MTDEPDNHTLRLLREMRQEMIDRFDGLDAAVGELKTDVRELSLATALLEVRMGKAIDRLIASRTSRLGKGLTMTDIFDLERRVAALEAAQRETAKTQTWMASTLGRIASVQDQHTVAIAALQTDVREVKADMQELQADMREVKADVKGLRADLPAMLADAVRDGMKGR